MGPGCGNRLPVTIFPDPPKPLISKIADTLFSSVGTGNQWFRDGSMISGATDPSLMIPSEGIYSVKVTGTDCEVYSDDFPTNRDTVIDGMGWQKIIAEANTGGSTVSVVQADDGGFVIGANYYLSGGQKMTLVKTDRNGNVLWSRGYGSDGSNTMVALTKVSGGYIITGTTRSFGNGNNDVYVLRVDLNGQIIWSNTYGDWNNQSAASITSTVDGNFVIAATSTDPHIFTTSSGGWPVNQNDIYLFKIDGNGNMLWNKRIDAVDGLEAYSVKESPAGNIIVSVNMLSGIVILQLDAFGNFQWNTGIHNSHWLKNPSVNINSDNSIIIGVNGYEATYILKLDSAGNSEWFKKLDAGYLSSIMITNDNNLLITTKSATFGEDMITFTDLMGNPIWGNTFVKLYNTNLIKSIQLYDGSFLLAGNIYLGSPYGSAQIYLVNTGINGRTNCTEINSPAISNESFSATLPAFQFSTLGAEKDVSTNSYNSLVFSVSPICTSIPYAIGVQEYQSINSFNVFPNPGTGIFNIEYNNQEGKGRINVYDISGRSLLSEKLTVSNTFQIDLSSASPGIYFIELLNEQGRAVKKVIRQ
jgi:hypothetical protein